jgi:hypothetical protein
MDKRNLARIFAIAFIVCGLIIGLAGCYGSICVRHYYGTLDINDSRVSILTDMYPGLNNVAPSSDGKKIFYNFRHYGFSKLDLNLEFTTEPILPLWVWIVFSLSYIYWGIAILRNNKILYKENDKHGHYQTGSNR